MGTGALVGASAPTSQPSSSAVVSQFKDPVVLLGANIQKRLHLAKPAPSATLGQR